MKKLSVGDVFEEAWQFTKQYGFMMSLLVVATCIISYAISLALPGPSMQEMMEAQKAADNQAIIKMYYQMMPGSMLTTLISFVFSAGIFSTVMGLVKKQKDSVDFSGFQMPVILYVKIVCSLIVASFIIGIGLICCILPGIFLAVRLMFVPLTYIDDPELPFFDGFKKSWAITSGQFLTLLGICIVSFMALIIGFICCCVGIFPAEVLVYFAVVIAYLTVAEGTPTPSKFEGEYQK